MNIILHIGVYKTGTTAIQKFCARNRERLLEQGILYPQYTTHDAHHPMPWSLGVVHRDRDPAVTPEFVAQAILDEARTTNAKTVILSSEEFRNTDVAALTKLKSLFPGVDFKIVVYLRRQDEFLISEYGQHVRMYSIRFSGTVYDFYMKYNFAGRYNYFMLLERWAKMFGDPAIVARVYDRRRFSGGNVIADFFQAIGFDFGNLELEREGSVNRNLAPVALEILRRSNALDINEAVHHRLLRLLDRTFAGDRREYHLLSDRNCRDVMELFGHSNALVAKRWLGREDGKLFDLDDPGPAATSHYDGSDQRMVADAILDCLVESLRPRR